MSVDTRFLGKKDKTNDRLTKIAGWYGTALGAFAHRREITYVPKLLITPYYCYRDSPLRPHLSVRIKFSGLTAVDPDDPSNKWAIYVLYTYVQSAAQRLNIANIAHEIAHLHCRITRGDPDPEQIYEAVQKKKSPLEFYQMQEKEVANIDSLYDEPVRSMIREMESEKRTGKYGRYFEGAQAVTTDEFYDKTLGPDLAEQFFERKFQEAKDRLSKRGLL
jgi:hypothetical protein